MEVQSYHRMPPQYASQAQALQAACNAFDGTCWDLASFSLFNLYPAMPAYTYIYYRRITAARRRDGQRRERLPCSAHGRATARIHRAFGARERGACALRLPARTFVPGARLCAETPAARPPARLPAGRTLCLSRPAGLCEGAGSVRLAQCGDVPRLAQIGCDAFAEGAPKNRCAISAARWTAQTPRCTCWEHGGLPAACVCAARSACGYELYGVCVRGDLRGRALRAPRWPAC